MASASTLLKSCHAVLVIQGAVVIVAQDFVGSRDALELDICCFSLVIWNLVRV
jgi:hypothetical protein